MMVKETKGWDTVSPDTASSTLGNVRQCNTQLYTKNVTFLGSPYSITRLTGPQYDGHTIIINNKWPTHPSVIRTYSQTCDNVTHVHTFTHEYQSTYARTYSTCHIVYMQTQTNTHTHPLISSLWCKRVVGSQLSLCCFSTEGGTKIETWATFPTYHRYFQINSLHNEAITFLVISELLIIKI